MTTGSDRSSFFFFESCKSKSSERPPLSEEDADAEEIGDSEEVDEIDNDGNGISEISAVKDEDDIRAEEEEAWNITMMVRTRRMIPARTNRRRVLRFSLLFIRKRLLREDIRLLLLPPEERGAERRGTAV